MIDHAAFHANLLVMNMMAPHLRPSSVFIATSMEITFDCMFLINSFLLGLVRGASWSEASDTIPTGNG